MALWRSIILLETLVCLATSHTVLTYPGWRGDTLHTTGIPPADNPSTLGVDYVNGTYQFPYGQEWIYPCGGLPLTTNRTKWPVVGGAVAFQPGWFPGHSVAFIYINIGVTEPGHQAPANMSFNVVPPFQIVGPTNEMYNGTVCLPQVPLPANASLKIGDNITIQVVESAQHGAALYNCVDVTLADPKDVPPVGNDTCFNSTNIGFRYLFTTTALSSSADPTIRPSTIASLSTILLASAVLAFW
ncbi:hypothetical protein ANO11243_001260 [Dothideomycetidae sp. 11243]|nr:hypothetical protein ANO11243_001260 [fungal sp. No.11243]